MPQRRGGHTWVLPPCPVEAGTRKRIESSLVRPPDRRQILHGERMPGREKDGPASSCRRGDRGRVAEGTVCLRERRQPTGGSPPPPPSPRPSRQLPPTAASRP